MALLALLATGCSGGASGAGSSSEPSAPRVFATPEEALSAAEQAFRAYQGAVDTAYQSGDPAGLTVVAAEPAISDRTITTDDFRSNGWHLVGTSGVDTLSLIYPRKAMAPPRNGVLMKGCIDYTAVDLVDSSGESVINDGTQARHPFLATLLWDASTFRVSEFEDWPDDDFCN